MLVDPFRYPRRQQQHRATIRGAAHDLAHEIMTYPFRSEPFDMSVTPWRVAEALRPECKSVGGSLSRILALG